MHSKLMHGRWRTQRGVSLLMALTLVVIVTSIITGVTLTSNYALRRNAILTHGQQAAAYAQGALALTEKALRWDGFSKQHDDWAKPIPPYPIEGGQVQGRIHELSSRFNLAMLSVNDAFEASVFRRLWQTLGGRTQTANAVIDAVRSQQFVSVIGVFAAAGVEEVSIHRIATYFTYLPINAERMNLNWVSPEVFAAYFDLSVERAKHILATRDTQPLLSRADIQRFAQRHGIDRVTTDSLQQNAPAVIELRFDVKSRYFQLIAEVTLGDARAVAVAMVDRNNNNITRLNQRLSKLLSE